MTKLLREVNNYGVLTYTTGKVNILAYSGPILFSFQDENKTKDCLFHP